MDSMENQVRKIHLLAITAGFLGTVAILTLVISLPIFFRDLEDLQDQVKEDMQEFKLITDEIWVDVVVNGGRGKRQSYGNQPQPPSYGPKTPTQNCNCNENTANRCPAGPPGPPGLAGEAGERGYPGDNGLQGFNGMKAFSHLPLNCPICPGSSRGPDGQPGRPGARGPPGNSGRPGPPSRPSQPSFSPPGDPGSPGRPGRAGPPGPPGRDGIRMPRPDPGSKGPPGSPGAPGQPGLPGKSASGQGAPGFPGQPGPPGLPGQPGTQGFAGPEGPPGGAGYDATYCPCPRRSANLLPGPYEPEFPDLESPQSTSYNIQRAPTFQAPIDVAFSQQMNKHFRDLRRKPFFQPEVFQGFQGKK